LSVDHRLAFINFFLLLGTAVAATPAMSSSPQVSIRNVNDWGSAFQGEAQVINTGSSDCHESYIAQAWRLDQFGIVNKKGLPRSATLGEWLEYRFSIQAE
jgi:hypothetical protein